MDISRWPWVLRLMLIYHSNISISYSNISYISHMGLGFHNCNLINYPAVQNDRRIDLQVNVVDFRRMGG